LNVTLLLCDAAQEAGGKLFVLGGGWSLVKVAGPVNMALAVLLEVPWDQANDTLLIEAKLMTDDGDPVELETGHPIMAAGQMEVGRPPGLKRGMSLNAPLAFTFNGVPLPPGGYRWELHINGEMLASAAFRALV